MKAYWGSGSTAPLILWPRHSMEVSVQLHAPDRFTPMETAPDTHWIGGWVGPRAVLDAMVKRKIPSPRRESNPRTPIVQPVAQRYTDWAITQYMLNKSSTDKGKKVKLFPCCNWAPRHEGVLGEWKYSSTHSLTSALDGGEQSASRTGRFPPGKEPLVPTG
jgi:hypothetical protein